MLSSLKMESLCWKNNEKIIYQFLIKTMHIFQKKKFIHLTFNISALPYINNNFFNKMVYDCKCLTFI
jgi:hypothetical protein